MTESIGAHLFGIGDQNYAVIYEYTNVCIFEVMFGYISGVYACQTELQ